MAVMTYTAEFKSLRGEVSQQEWQARVDLAACYRLVDKYGMTDLIYNHITARVPGSEGHLLINLYGLLYKEITASNLVKIDLDGEIKWKPETDYGINKSGYVIHGAIHKARPDVACVLHTHTRAGMAVAAMKCGLLRCRKPRSGSSAISAITIMKGLRLMLTSANASSATSARTMR
jgi:ribulose-5-phosphate 4-epimerase/fuculose-1-phosphate aldolase